MKRLNRGRKFLLFILIAPVAIFLLGGAVMLLWNNVLTPVLHVSTITFWQGLGIFVLAKLLFGGFRGRRGAGRFFMKQRMMWNAMTPEQQEKLKQEWKNCRGWRHRSWGPEVGVE